MQETRVRSLGWEDPLKKKIATHFSILAWRIPWTEEPGGLQSVGSQRAGCDWMINIFTFIAGEVVISATSRLRIQPESWRSNPAEYPKVFDHLRALRASVCAKLLQLFLTLYDSMDCSQPGSSVHGILQARILEWVTIPFSRGSS